MPYSYYGKAMEILIGINAANPDETAPEDELEIENTPEAEEFEEMSSGKRIAVRIVSIVLFILLVALVVGGVDFITGAIKNLFV